jgi:cysteine-rich repeat protein
MYEMQKRTHFFLGIFFGVFALVLIVAAPDRAHAFTATTTVRISVCGNAIVEAPGEACDDGVNIGQYASSTATRTCMPDCSAFAPYCGDNILQSVYGEQCDDGNNTSNDGCSSSCQIESTAPLPGPGPSAGGGGFAGGAFSTPNPTKVVVQGKAYPGSSVNILKDGSVLGVVQADTSANFYFSTTNISPGVATFGFWAQDASGLKSIALTTTFTITANAVTTISGEFLPPTISIDKRQVKQGEGISVSGQSAPSVTVQTHFHSSEEIIASTTSDNSGNWKLTFNTKPLANNDFHTVSADFVSVENGAVSKSTVSQALSFYVGTKNVGKGFIADLNSDGKVNLADFSILLFYWGTSTPLADLNSDGKVDLRDFSILLFNWTG